MRNSLSTISPLKFKYKLFTLVAFTTLSLFATEKQTLVICENPFSRDMRVNLDSIFLHPKDSVLFFEKDTISRKKNSVSTQEKSKKEQTNDSLSLSKQQNSKDTGANANIANAAKVPTSSLDTLNLAANTYDELRDSVAPKEPPFVPIEPDIISLQRNPLFIDLVYMGLDIDIDWKYSDSGFLFAETAAKSLTSDLEKKETPSPEKILTDLRAGALKHITHSQLELYKTTFDQLPRLSWNTYKTQKGESEQIFFDGRPVPEIANKKIHYLKKGYNPWDIQVNSLLQFSQISVSKNWHKGGNNYLTLLGILSARIDYDNKKTIRWENYVEGRSGFNTVAQDSLRSIMPSDDLLKGSSKFGLKAGGNLYYSSSLEFQTQFFNNPKGINSRELKAKFLTPLRLNLGLGVDYKQGKNLSIAVSPVSYKVIYLADTTRNIKHPEASINPNAFGIEKGKNLLHEFGSKVIVILKDYSPLPDLKLNSRLSFYTNYKKVEVDWEIVSEYTINRFLSTRLMLNPRFDNTAILKKDEKARLQMKEMLTIGLSCRLY